MIRNRAKAHAAIPAILEGEAQSAQETLAVTGDKSAIDDYFYKGEVVRDRITNRKSTEVQQALLELYHYKCAYCESKDFRPEIEHYRPKKRVSGVRNHPGYYWLAYNWDNLLPSCRYCNTSGGKGDKFTIQGERVTSPPLSNDRLNWELCHPGNSPLKDEKPYLFHPEVDEPEDAFRFSISGSIQGVDEEGRGSETIRICLLNRGNLLYRRKHAIDSLVVKPIQIALVQLDRRRIPVGAAAAMINGVLEAWYQYGMKDDSEYALLHRYLWAHFMQEVLPVFEEDFRPLVATVYEEAVGSLER